jgi:hypothetical protein
MDNFDDLRRSISTEIGVDCAKATIDPVRICGNRFAIGLRKLSSTYRERVAVLNTLGECRSIVEGPVVVISDNRNCKLEWHNIETLGALLIELWQLYCETVVSTTWLSRDSYPSLSDLVARIIADDSEIPDSKPNENMNAASATLDVVGMEPSHETSKRCFSQHMPVTRRSISI